MGTGRAPAMERVRIRMSGSQSLKTAIETKLGLGPSERGQIVLRGVTDLFVNRAEDYSDEQVAVFDDVMQCLLDHAEHTAKVELSGRLAPVGRAPKKVMHALITDKDPAVSGPLIKQSRAVSDADLGDIIKNADKDMLLVIANRPHVTKSVSDKLFARDIPEVTYAVLANQAAEISEASLVKLIGESGNDPKLGTLIEERKDLPEELRPFLDAYKPKSGKPQGPRVIKSGR